MIDRVIEEKETALAQVHKIQYENIGLQGEIRAHRVQIQDLIANRHVPRRGVIDIVLRLIDKQCENELHKWYMIRCKYRTLDNHKKWLQK